MSKPVSYQPEIIHLMTRAGDAFKPCSTSCTLVEKHLLTELERLAHQVADSADMRNSTTITPDDFAFQLRKNKRKLFRVNEYLTKRKLLLNKQKTYDDEEIDIDPELELDFAHKPWKRRKVTKKLHFKILAESDRPNLLFLDTYDSLAWLRMQRNDNISQGMSAHEYENYTIHCRHSFLKPTCEIFSSFTKLIPPPYLAAEKCAQIVGYLAHEMVSQLVELATQLYRDMSDLGICPHCSSDGIQSTSSIVSNESSSTNSSCPVLPCLQPKHFNEALRRFYSKNKRHALLIL